MAQAMRKENKRRWVPTATHVLKSSAIRRGTRVLGQLDRAKQKPWASANSRHPRSDAGSELLEDADVMKGFGKTRRAGPNSDLDPRAELNNPLRRDQEVIWRADGVTHHKSVNSFLPQRHFRLQ